MHGCNNKRMGTRNLHKAKNVEMGKIIQCNYRIKCIDNTFETDMVSIREHKPYM